MSNEARTTGTPPSDGWTVTGTRSATDDGRARVDVVIRGKVEGRIDRGGGVDQLRFAIWDDGQELDARVVDIPLGRSGMLTVRLGFEGDVAVEADGIGIAITAGSDAHGERVFDLDPFFPEVVR